MRRAIGYAFLFAWVAFAGGVQLLLLACAPQIGSDLAAFVRASVPDLMTLVLVASVGRLASRDVIMIGAVAALARVAFTGASPFAILAGSIAVALVADAIRGFAELDRPSLRFFAAGSGALAFGLWLLFVDLARSGAARESGALGFGRVEAGDVLLPFATAVMTALVGLLLWPVLQRLPGLGKLERRAF